MPQALAFVAAAATAAAQVAASAAFIATGSFAVAGAVASITLAAVPLGLSLAATSIFSALTAPSIPPPDAITFTLVKSATPARRSGYGRSRASGPYMTYGVAADGTATDVVALHEGPIQGFVDFYLGDDKITRSGQGWVNGCPARNDGRYSTGSADKVQILTRTGAAGQAAITTVANATIPDWGSSYRGDGIAYVVVGARTPLAKHYTTIYPNGELRISAIADWSAEVVDTRTGEAGFSENPANCIADFITNTTRGGMGLSWAARIEPELAYWQAGAEDCDSLVDGEPRYRLGGQYEHVTSPASVLQTQLDTCDGWIGQTWSGGLRFYSGRYQEPEITIGPDQIVGYEWQIGVPDEDATNVLVTTFTSAEHDYTTVEAEPWRDEASIARRGEKPGQFDLPWVSSNGQVRRLAKRRGYRLRGDGRGKIYTNLGAIEALGHRYIHLDFPELGIDGPVEVLPGGEEDYGGLQLTFVVQLIGPAIDDWDGEVETGPPPVVVTPTSPGALAAPAITGLSVVRTDANADIQGVAIDVALAAVGREDAEITLRWRAGSGPWAELTYTDIADTGAFTLRIPSVPAQATIGVQAELRAGDGRVSAWSATSTVGTTVDQVIPDLIVARFEEVEGRVDDIEGELTAARDTFPTLDGRLDDMEADIAAAAAASADGSAALAEIAAARGGYGSLDGRLDVVAGDASAGAAAASEVAGARFGSANLGAQIAAIRGRLTAGGL